MRTRCKQQGFTLIELAVVIAIIAILAAVAIPKFANTTGRAERAKAADFVSQLTSAAAIYTANQATTPTAFSDFVGTAAADTIDPAGFNNGLKTACSAALAGCTFNDGNKADYAFNNGSVTCTWTNGGTQPVGANGAC